MSEGFHTCVYLDEESTSILTEVLFNLGIEPNLSFPYHVTIISSLSKPKTNFKYDKKISLYTKGFFLLGDNNLVLGVESSLVNKLHNFYTNKGAVHTFDKFSPHITISEFNFSKVPVNFPILRLEGYQSDFSSLIF